jgi:D-beta-D-heptose 7-phosphate kinase/D-beta-D-heptose 1-phosphate adenosyltransferase
MHLPDFSGLRILVIGDVMLDQYVYGTVNRISPEAPVPVFRTVATVDSPGGAANVAVNAARLGAVVTVVGADGIADDPTIIHSTMKNYGDIRIAFSHRAAKTTIKRRFICDRHQMFREDIEGDPHEVDGWEIAKLVDGALRAEPHAVIIADYGKGVVTQELLSRIILDARALGIPTFVDTKQPLAASYCTWLKPNLKEAAVMLDGQSIENDHEAERAARDLAMAYDCGVLLTRGPNGITMVHGAGKKAHHVGAEKREVFDVSGAGDTVLAVFALMITAGRDPLEAARMANKAGGIVVGKEGTYAIERAVLEAAIEPERLSAPRAPIVGWTNGCFDVLHPGHLRLLREARMHCDRLILGLNTDRSIERLKGKGRPINSFMFRRDMLLATGFVDEIVPVTSEETLLEAIALFDPEMIIKGEEYREKHVAGAERVESRGGKVVFVPMLAGYSTTKIIERIRG